MKRRKKERHHHRHHHHQNRNPIKQYVVDREHHVKYLGVLGGAPLIVSIVLFSLIVPIYLFIYFSFFIFFINFGINKEINKWCFNNLF